MKKAIVPLGILVLVIFGVFMYINRFTIFHTSGVDGIVFATNDMATNLAAGINEESPKITYENVKINETIYKSGKKYYIGEETKKNVNLDYPIVSTDTSSLLILNDKGNFVDETFVKSATYENSILNEGTLYNGVNNTKVSDDKYIFLEVGNGIYVNLVELNVKRNGEDHKIPINSFIYFEQSFLRHYTLKNGVYKFTELAGIEDTTETVVGETKYDYFDFLVYLGVITPKEDKQEEIIEEILTPEEQQSQIQAETKPPSGIIIPNEPYNPGNNYAEGVYIKPEARISNTSANVYSYKGHIEIYDPAQKISKSPTLEFKIGRQVKLRFMYNKSMDFESIGLEPDTEYDVEAYFIYYGADGQKYKTTFFTETIKSKDISKLETLKLEIDNIEPGMKTVKLGTLKLNNKKGDEVLKGLKFGTLSLNNIHIQMAQGIIMNLADLKTQEYETGESLSTATAYHGKIVFEDFAGNELVVTGNEFDFETLKTPPIAKIGVELSNNFTLAKAQVEMTNPDRVEASRYRYVLYEYNSQKIVQQDSLRTPEEQKNQNVDLINLNAETKYIFKVYCDYVDSANGKLVKDYVMQEYTFTTFDAARLGTVKFDIQELQTTQNELSIRAKFLQYSESNPVFGMMENEVIVTLTNIEDPDETIIINVPKNEFIAGRVLDFTELSSNSTYELTISTRISSGCGIDGECSYYLLPTNPEKSGFKTDKAAAVVHVANGFVASKYVDFDICIEDPDESINREYPVQILFKKLEAGTPGTIVDTHEIMPKDSCAATTIDASGALVNAYEEYDRIIASDNIDADTSYQINIFSQEYNTKHTLNTKTTFNEYINNLKASGTSGDLKIIGLTNEVNYKLNEDLTCDVMGTTNLFDISNNSRWKTTTGGESKEDKEIRIDDNELILKAYRGYSAYSYYLPELQGRSYAIKYDYEYEQGTAGDRVTIVTNDDFTGGNGKNMHTSSDSGSAREVIVSQTGKYLTFYVTANEDIAKTSTIKLKNIQINCNTSDDSIEYEDFGGEANSELYVGEFYARFEGLMEENLNTIPYPEKFNEKSASEYKYYVNYYLNGVKLEEAEGDTVSVDNLLPEQDPSDPTKNLNYINQNLIKREIVGNQNLEARLGVSTEIGGTTRYYDLKTVKFSSEAETRTLKTAQDFMDMHAYGYYILDLEGQPNTCTLPENQEGQCISLTGKHFQQTFQGSIDFQGNKVEVITTGTTHYGLFEEIGGGGVVKNLDLHMHIANTVSEGSLANPITSYTGLAKINNGTISNIKVSLSGFYQPRKFRNQFTTDPDTGEEVLVKEWIYDVAHSGISLVTSTNGGTVENFLLDLETELIVSGSTGLVALTNSGTIKNGYVIGENINAGYSTGTTGVGIIASSSSSNSRINNVYSLIDVVVHPPEYEEGYKIRYDASQLDEVNHLVPIENTAVTSNTAAGIVYSASSAFIENAIVIDPRIIYNEYEKYQYETNRSKTSDPMIINGGSSTISNLNYIGIDTFRKQYHEVAIISHLKEGEFMEATLNSDGMFNTKEASSIGQLPRLLWPNNMPEQEIIKIPEYNESDRLKILSVNTVTPSSENQKFNYDGVEYDTEVKFSIYNPQNFKIVGLELDGFAPEDIKVAGRSGINSAKQEMITLYINEPERYMKNYNITEIYINEQTAGNTIGALTKACFQADKTILDNDTEFDCSNLPYLTLDLYLEVKTISEALSAAENYYHQNFSLTQDIDFADAKFSGEPTKIDEFNITLNGNGHTIKNLTAGNCYIKEFYGEIKNLNVENYKVEYENDLTNYAGLICSSYGGIIDNVHIKDEELLATAWDDEYGGNPWSDVYMGGIIAKSSDTIIKNSSVTNIHLPEINSTIPGEKNRYKDYAERAGKMDAGVLTIGGLVGYASSTDITNSFARKVKFSLNPYEEGVDDEFFTDYKFGFLDLNAAGGIVGQISSGKIENVYATGTIDSKIGSGNAYIGGLVGYTAASISSAISYVNVYTVTLGLGGMIGNAENEYGNVASKTLVLGDVLTSVATDEITKFRTSGNPIQANKNFAWFRQAMNSQVSANTSNEELLNDEDLSNPAIYSTKIGLSANDFTLGLDNYRKVAYDKDDNMYEVSYDTELKEVEKEEESFDVVDLNTGETVKVMEVHGTLPKLLHSETGEVLNNQSVGLDTVINYVELFSISEIESITYINVDPAADGDASNYSFEDTEIAMGKPGNYGVVNYLGRVVEVVAYIRNPNKLQIDSIEIEDMDVLNLNVVQTSYDLTLYQAKIYAKAKPNKNKDSYNITCINYRLQGEAMQYRATIKFDVSIYGAINSAEDWNGIKKGTYQNFAVVGDVDFNDIPPSEEIVIDLTFNKLLGIYKDYVNDDGSSEQRGPVIKNFDNADREQIMGAGNALISEIKSEGRYLNFENITLTNNSGSSSGSYFGIIKNMTGELYGHLASDTISNDYIDFTNIKIDGKTGMNYVGCIAYNKSPYMQYVRGTNVEVHGGTYVGGLIGYSAKKPKYDLYGKNMVVIGQNNYVGGLIGYDYGSSTKITYDIAVDGVYVSGYGYVGGAIGYGSSQQAAVIGRTTKLNGYTLNTIRGSGTCVGGIFGYLYATSSKFYVENLNVSGYSKVGGISGQNYWYLSQASVINSNINASYQYAGGISGYGSDRIYNNIVSGGTIYASSYYAGGIVGYTSYTVYSSYVGHFDGTPTIITASRYAGGIAGYSTSSIYNNFASSNVTANYSVGGIVGYASGSSVYNNIVGGSTITSNSTTSHSISSSSPMPETSGKTFYMSYIGGVIGQMNGYSLGGRTNVINAKINAKVGGENIDYSNPTYSRYAGAGYYAGGYMYAGQTYYRTWNSDTKSYKYTYYWIDQSMPTGDKATNYYGYTSAISRNYISTSAYPYIYENSTLNDVAVSGVTSHPIFTVSYSYFRKRTDTQMRTISGSTYNNVSSFTAMPGDTSTNLMYYPYPNGLIVRSTDDDLFNALNSEMVYEVSSMADVATQIETSTSASVNENATETGRPDFHILPDFDVYASDVDKINIEFAEIDPYTYIQVNGEKYYIKQNTFTFYYDFKEDFAIEIGDGINSKEVTISVDDVKNGTTVIGEYYYYLENGEVITNQPRDLTKEEDEETEIPVAEENSNKVEDKINEIISEGVAYQSSPPENNLITAGINIELSSVKEHRFDGGDDSALLNNATNIYGEEVLLDNQDIYNIATGETKENSFENLTLVDFSKPLYEFTYANQNIKTYYNYSIIDGKYIDKQVYVKNGRLEVVDQNLDSDKSAILIDSYNDKEFLVYLGGDGKLHSLKDDIEYPKNFKNINIKGISTNITSNTNMMIVEYKDGSKVIFNYVTGQLVSSRSDEPISLGDYVKQYLEISSDELFSSTKTNSKYEEAKKLAKKLNETPIEQVLNSGEHTGEGALLDNNKYTVVYDPLKGDYYVYEIPSESDSGQVKLTESLSASMDSVIDADPILVEYYRGDSYNTISTVSSIIITIAVITGIAGAVVYLSKYFKKNKKKEA